MTERAGDSKELETLEKQGNNSRHETNHINIEKQE